MLFIEKEMTEEIENFELLSGITEDIQQGELTIHQILEKYSITMYRYNQIRNKLNLKKAYVLKDNKRVKTTSFTRMLDKFSKASNEVKEVDETQFNLDEFKKACNEKMKIVDLMKTFSLTLYQIQELKKRYNLKNRYEKV